MTQTMYLQFDGLKNPVALENASRLVPMISEVLAGWPHTASPVCQSQPFVTIRPSAGDYWSISLGEAPSDLRDWNAVNAVCDLVAEMAWERLRSDPTLLCLHAAAVAFDGRLVVFPNARRAGKSTIAAALGQLGHKIYTDDFLPVRTDPESLTFHGIANGVAPRIRLPLPDGFSDTFHAWVQQDPGPSNKQYKYLSTAPVAPGGETMPLGAVVVLERQDDPTEPLLEVIPRADALASLITQNFARTQLSGAILNAADVLTHHLPLYRLTYHNGEQAAQFLASHPALRALPTAKSSAVDGALKQAPLEMLGQPAPQFMRACPYVQAAGLTETKVGHDHFLADSNGLAIYRLNAGSVAIWNVLKEPANLDEVIEILAAAFEDVATTQIATDSEDLMRSLVAAQLIVPARAEVAVR